MKKQQVSHALLLSGGLDSTSLLCYLLGSLKIHKERIACFYFVTNSRQTKQELKAIVSITSALSVKLYKNFIGLNWGESIMQTENKPKKISGTVTEESMKQVIVPNRNMLFLSVLINQLYSPLFVLPTEKNPITVLYGAHSDDKEFPDCLPEFIDSIAKAVSISTQSAVKLSAPFVTETKKSLAKHCFPSLIPFTYSCYMGTDPECGECMTCNYKKQALKGIYEL